MLVRSNLSEKVKLVLALSYTLTKINFFTDSEIRHAADSVSRITSAGLGRSLIACPDRISRSCYDVTRSDEQRVDGVSRDNGFACVSTDYQPSATPTTAATTTTHQRRVSAHHACSSLDTTFAHSTCPGY